ncbi:MAG: helix-turn-helix domain-containing protein [Anaerolineae bacterium]|nr:helix-turn-helix domain-containing protein [Anaerolineae bacterium]NUQ07195.1 helix-turn-helix domain-containing protein [Anaerolineae bacterium]
MNWMKSRREEIRLTQDEIVTQLQMRGVEVSRSAYAAWETGRNPPPLISPDFRSALANIFKLSETELLRRAGLAVYAEHTNEGERAADIVDALEPERRNLALKLLEQLLPN